MSVEESNALRASLGLKPLRLTGSAGAVGRSSRNPVLVTPAAEKRPPAEERVAAARARRSTAARDAQLSGPSLGAQLLANTGGTAAQWVQGARQRAAAGRAARAGAPTRARGAASARPAGSEGGAGADDDEHSVLIRHSASDFAEGRDAVLTLADSSLLDERGRALAADATVAEEAGLSAAAAVRARAERASKAKRPAYDPYGEADVGGGGGLLSHYDDYDGIDPTLDGRGRAGAGGPGLAVGRGGAVVDLEDAERVRRRLELARQGVTEEAAAPAADGVVMEDGRVVLDASKDVMAGEEAEAEAAEEAVAASKRERRRARKAAKSRRRRGPEEEDGAAAAGEDAPPPPAKRARGVTEELRAAAAGVAAGADRGSRSRGAPAAGSSAVVAAARDREEEAEAAGSGRRAFDAAVGTAVQEARRRLDGVRSQRKGRVARQAAAPGASVGSRQRRYGAALGLGGGGGEDGEEDADYELDVARARRLAAERHAPGADAEGDSDDEDASARVLEAVARMAERRAALAEAKDGAAPSSVVFTATGEYTRRLGSSVDARKRAAAAARARAEHAAKGRQQRLAHDAAQAGPGGESQGEAPSSSSSSSSSSGAASAPGGALAAVEEVRKQWAEVKQEDPARAASPRGGGDAHGAFGEATALVGGSLSAALAHVKRIGVVAPPSTRDAQSGRAKDRRMELSEYAAPAGEGYAAFQLEYLDEFGRHRTRSDEYRALSYRVHGKGPSSRRREKVYQQVVREQEEAKARAEAEQAAAGNAEPGKPGALASAARELQARKGQPFVRLK